MLKHQTFTLAQALLCEAKHTHMPHAQLAQLLRQARLMACSHPRQRDVTSAVSGAYRATLRIYGQSAANAIAERFVNVRGEHSWE